MSSPRPPQQESGMGPLTDSGVDVSRLSPSFYRQSLLHVEAPMPMDGGNNLNLRLQSQARPEPVLRSRITNESLNINVKPRPVPRPASGRKGYSTKPSHKHLRDVTSDVVRVRPSEGCKGSMGTYLGSLQNDGS